MLEYLNYTLMAVMIIIQVACYIRIKERNRLLEVKEKAFNDAVRWSDWGKEYVASRYLKDRISDKFRELIDYKLTEDDLKKIANRLRLQLDEDFVKHNADAAIAQMNSEAITEIREKYMSDILAHINVQAVSNAVTLSMANEFMGRMGERRLNDGY